MADRRVPMRILWIVNLVMPELAEHLGIQTSASGTWLFDMAERLSADDRIELAVACVHGSRFEKVTIGSTAYYMLPGTGRNMLFYTKKYPYPWNGVFSWAFPYPGVSRKKASHLYTGDAEPY